MNWFIYAILSALLIAGTDAATKGFFGRTTWPTMALFRMIWWIPVLALTYFRTPWPHITVKMLVIVLIALPLELGAMVMYNQAIFLSPLSTTLPFLAFNPIFVTLIAYLTMGETVSLPGMSGIILVAAGAYVIHLDRFRPSDLLAPVRAMFSEPGCWRMIVVSALWSCTAVLGKMGLLEAGIGFFPFFFIILSLISGFGLVYWGGANPRLLIERWPVGLLIGLLIGSSVMCHALGVVQIEAAYMVAVKRSHALFGVIFGLIIFKEGLARQRLLGAGLAVAGAAIIGLS